MRAHLRAPVDPTCKLCRRPDPALDGAILAVMDGALPSFDPDDVALLVTAVEQAMQRLHDANERVGGNDRELIEYGRRYSVLLQKLQDVLSRSRP